MKKTAKRILSIICALTLLTILVGCFNRDPKGVYIDNNGLEYYKIKLPSGSRASNYFDGMHNGKTIVVSPPGETVKPSVIVYLYELRDGGHVAYSETKPNEVTYFSPGFSEIRLRTLASGIAFSSYEYMSIEDAREYIPSLND